MQTSNSCLDSKVPLSSWCDKVESYLSCDSPTEKEDLWFSVLEAINSLSAFNCSQWNVPRASNLVTRLMQDIFMQNRNESLLNTSNDVLERCFRICASFEYPDKDMQRYLDAILSMVSAPLTLKNTSKWLQCVIILGHAVRNVTLGMYVKESKSYKKVLMACLEKLNHPEKKYTIYSMRVLSSLILHESAGTDIFTTENVSHAFSMILTDLLSEAKSSEEAILKMDEIELIEKLATGEPRLLLILEQHPKLSTCLGRAITLIGIVKRADSIGKATNELLTVVLRFLFVLVNLSHGLKRKVTQLIVDSSKDYNYNDVISNLLGLASHTDVNVAIECSYLLTSLLKGNKALLRSIQSAFPRKKSATTDDESHGEVYEKLATLNLEGSDDSNLFPDKLSARSSIVRMVYSIERMESNDHAFIGQVGSVEAAKYTLAVHLCHLLKAMCTEEQFSLFCMSKFKLSKLKQVVQSESRALVQLSAADRVIYPPKLSMAILGLMGELLQYDSEPIARHIQQLFKSNSISTVVGYGLCEMNTKAFVFDMLQFLKQLLNSELVNQHVGVLNIADGVFAHNQRNLEVLNSLREEALAAKRIEEAQEVSTEHKQREICELNEEIRENALKYENALSLQRSQYAIQLQQQKDAGAEVKKNYENQVLQLKSHCEQLNELFHEKLNNSELRDRALEEERAKRRSKEEENSKLLGKLQYVESRMSEVAHSRAIISEESSARARELEQERYRVEEISDAFSTQSIALSDAMTQIETLKLNVDEKENEIKKALEKILDQSNSYKRLEEQNSSLKDDLTTRTRMIEEAEAVGIKAQKELSKSEVQLEKCVLKNNNLEAQVKSAEASMKAFQEQHKKSEKHLEQCLHRIELLENEASVRLLELEENKVLLEKRDLMLEEKDDTIKMLNSKLEKHEELQKMINKMTGNG